MRHPVCKNSGRAHVVGMVYNGEVRWHLPQGQPWVICARCGKQLTRGTIVGKVLAHDITQLFEYLRYHKDTRPPEEGAVQ